MRMRRKKHLAERVEKVSDILTVSDSDVLNCVIAERYEEEKVAWLK